MMAEQWERGGAEGRSARGAGQYECEGRTGDAHDRAFMTHDEEPCLQLVPKS